MIRPPIRSLCLLALMLSALVSTSGCYLTSELVDWASEPLPHNPVRPKTVIHESGQDRLIFHVRSNARYPEGYYAFSAPNNWRQMQLAYNEELRVLELAQPLPFVADTGYRRVARRYRSRLFALKGHHITRRGPPATATVTALPTAASSAPRSREEYGYIIRLGHAALDPNYRASGGRTAAAIFMAPLTLALDTVIFVVWVAANIAAH